jgi:hypothetical protein
MYLNRCFASFAALSVTLTASAFANAEEPAPPEPSGESPPVVAPVTPPPSVPAPAAEAAPKPGCRLATHSGIPEPDANTVASLICRELESKGATMTRRYRVELDALGNSVYLTLTDEDGSGTAASRRIRLNEIEEAFDAAPRLVDALLSGKNVTETERVGNLTDAEARAPLRKSGTLQVGVGAMGVYAPGVSTLAPGFELSLRYDTPSWVTHSTLRYGAHVTSDGEGRDEGLRVFDWGVGARYMLTKQDIAPFIGAGLAYMAVQRDAHSENGLGAFAEAGIEMLRLHRNHFSAALRADAPMFSISKRYVLPLSLTVTATF